MKLITTVFLIPLLAAFSTLAAHAADAPRSLDLVAVKCSLAIVPGAVPKGQSEASIKILTIALTGLKTVAGKLQVTTTFYARDLGRRRTVVEKKIDNVVELDVDHFARIVTPGVPFICTTEHFQKNGTGRNAKAVKVEASGHRYYGWVVRVNQGDKLLGEAASSVPMLKEDG